MPIFIIDKLVWCAVRINTVTIGQLILTKVSYQSPFVEWNSVCPVYIDPFENWKPRNKSTSGSNIFQDVHEFNWVTSRLLLKRIKIYQTLITPSLVYTFAKLALGTPRIANRSPKRALSAFSPMQSRVVKTQNEATFTIKTTFPWSVDNGIGISVFRSSREKLQRLPRPSLQRVFLSSSPNAFCTEIRNIQIIA